jgi:DNA-binding NarL/FixJ family response regulator
MENRPPLVYLLSDDLVDASKTIGAGRALGIVVKQFRTPALLAQALTDQPDLVILDVQVGGLDLSQVLRPGLRAIAYGSHVDAARLREARSAGCEHVMPRSQYFEQMPMKLAEWLNRQAKEQ